MGRLMLALLGLALAFMLVLPAGARNDDPARWPRGQWTSREFAAPPFARRYPRVIVVKPVIAVTTVVHAQPEPASAVAPAAVRPRLITIGQAPAPSRTADGGRRTSCTGVLLITWTERGPVRSCRGAGIPTATR